MPPADSSPPRAAHSAPLLPAASAEMLLQSMPWGVLLLAPDGTVAVLNPQAETLWGVPAAAVLGQTPVQVQPSVLPAELLQALTQAAAPAPEANEVEYWLPHTRQWVAQRSAPAPDGGIWVYWDNITRRRQAEQDSRQHHAAQQQTSQLLLAVEEVAYTGSYEADLETKHFHFSDGLFRLFGEAPQSFVPTLDFIDSRSHPDDVRVGQDLLVRLVNSQEPYRYLHRIYRTDGQLRTLEVHASLLYDPAGTPVKLLGLVQDVTERQQAEAEVLRTQQALAQQATDQYQGLFQALDQGYFLAEVEFDAHDQAIDILYLDANPAATRMVGQDFTGRRLKDLDPGYEAYWYAIFGRVARTGASERLERFAEPDQKWYDFYVFKVGNEASRRVAVVFQDVTARKQSEKALRESEAQIAADLTGMRRLYELQARLADQFDAQVALRDVLAVACAFTGTDRGCVQLLSPDGQRLEMAVWQGYPDDSPFINFFRCEALETGHDATRVQRKRLIIEDTVGFPGLEGTAAGAAADADHIRAAQSTPITSRGGETIGVISTQFRQPHRPTDHQLRLLDMLAWTAAEFLERHRAEAARRESEQQFRLMADAVPQIVWLTDADGRVTFFNQQWSNYTGAAYEPTTAAEVAARFVHPDDGAATMAAFNEARATGTTFLVEHRIRSRAGDYRWFLVRAEPYREAGTGEISRWFGASVDIHDRKQAEEALAHAHERLQLAMNVGRIFSFEMNPATRALELSDNVDSVMGSPLPAHIDSTFELIHPDDLQPTVALINGAIDARGSYASEYRLVNPANGEVFWFHSQAAFTKSSASGEWRFVGIAQNITESKRAEEALRESEAQYRTLFNSMDEGYYLLEVVFDERGEATDVLYVDANPAAIRLSGGDRRGKSLREVGHYEAYWYELFGRVARTGVSERTEQFSSPAGIWVNSYTFKVSETGNRVASVFRDVTDRKRREANQVFLADLTTEFTRSATVDDIMQNVGAKIGAYLNVVSVVFTDVDETQGQVTVSHGWVQTGALSIVGNSYRLDDYATPEFGRLSRANEPFVVRDTQTDPRTDAAFYAALQMHAWVVIPFHHHGAWQHSLTTYDAQPRDWRPDEVELFRELSAHIFPRLERARADEALRASEEKYRSLFETMDQGFAVCELLRDEAGQAIDFRYLALNPIWEQQTGLRRDRTLGRTVKQLIPGIEEWWIEAFARVVDTNEPMRMEYYIEAFSQWYQVLAFPQGGQRFAAIYDDITARKKAEETLRRSEARQAYLLRLSDALNLVADAVEMQARVTDTAMHYFGADRCYYCELDGDTVTIRRDAARPGLPSVAATYLLSTMPVFQAMLQERKPVVVADVPTAVMDDNLKQLCLGFGIIAYINVPVIKNGEQVGMLCLTQGTPREWTALEIDLVQETAERTWAAVERAHAEAALQASEQRQRLAIEAADMGTWDWLLPTDEIHWNDQHFALFGRAPQPGPVASEDFARQLHPDDRAWVWERLQAAVMQRHVFEAEFRIVRADDGETRWMSGYGQAVATSPDGDTQRMGGVIFDITPRKRAEQQLQELMVSLEAQVTQRTQALRESQELLQSVFDTSLISMSVLKAVRDEAGIVQDFRIVMANRELEKETGRTDLVGRLYAQEYPGIQLTGLYDRMLGVLETGEPAGLEYFYPHEGFNKWYACQFVKMDDGLVATNLDITERKLAEEQSREQAHFIARINETLPDLMTVTELPSGRVVYVNQDPYEAPGFEREKLLNVPLQAQTDLLRMHPDDAALLPDYFVRAAALADQEIATYSYRAKFDTDQWRWFQVRGSVFQRDPATGAATQILSVAQDVTAQKEAEMQQAKSYQLLQQSEEVASLGSWEYDRSTGEFRWSAGMYRLFELAPDSPVQPETYLAFALAEDRPVAQRIVQGLTSGRRGFEETLRMQVGEAVKTVRVKAAVVLDDAGEPLRVLGVDLDISEVQRLEAENLRMRLTQQQALFSAVLEAQETERGRLAESLHNGLGQTLYATKLQLNQLLVGSVPTALARADQLLADAIRQTRTLSHELVPTVLNEFGLPAALRSICHNLRSPHLHFDCTVELDGEQPLPQLLQVALYRMAQELTQNVVKHARASEATLALETVPGFVLLRVEDNGVGFTTAPAAGAGIGLRTIRDRVALLGGTVDLGSSPKFGTYVRLRLPVASPAA